MVGSSSSFLLHLLHHESLATLQRLIRGARAWAPESAQELGWLSDAPWAKVGLVITVAVFVLTLGGAMAKRRPGSRGVRTQGKRDFDLHIAKLESLAITPIATASAGPVHFEGVLASSNETLGGPPETARVYYNRKGASRHAAVAAQLVLLSDESGQVSLESLETARVIAATDPKPDGRSQAPDTISLHLGDRVQVLGYFRAEMHGDDAQAANRVYGSLGEDGQIQVRLVERRASPAPEHEAEASSPAEPRS